MKVATCSIVCGSQACNARCPFCISKMTPGSGTPPQPTQVNWDRFKIFMKAAANMQASTYLLTGRGEPTLYGAQISGYLSQLRDSPVPFRELQTNGIQLMKPELNDAMATWNIYGLNTICVSAVHFERWANQEIYSKEYPELGDLVKRLHGFGFSVRLSLMLIKDFVDDDQDVYCLIRFCKDHRIDQLTIRPIAAPGHSVNGDVALWTAEHTIHKAALNQIHEMLESRGDVILELPHGGTVYDVEGQNVCLANCITTSKTTEDIRQIIFYPEGRISHDWKYEGAVLV